MHVRVELVTGMLMHRLPVRATWVIMTRVFKININMAGMRKKEK